MQVALHHAREVVDHVVAQVVEAELAVLAVGDVGEVRLSPRDVTPVAVPLVHRLERDAGVVDRGLLVRDVRHAHPEKVVDRRHPAGTRLGEVVVRRDEVRALAGERVQVERGGGDERLAFTGLHLRDVALVERHRAHELLVEVALAQRPARRLADGGERLREDVVELLFLRQALAELGGARAQRVLGKRLRGFLERVDLLDDLPQSSKLALVGVEETPQAAHVAIARSPVAASVIPVD